MVGRTSRQPVQTKSAHIWQGYQLLAEQAVAAGLRGKQRTALPRSGFSAQRKPLTIVQYIQLSLKTAVVRRWLISTDIARVVAGEASSVIRQPGPIQLQLHLLQLLVLPFCMIK